MTLAAQVPPLERRRFSGDEWDRMVRLGLFGPDERLELIDGEVVVLSPIGDVHAVVSTLLVQALNRSLGKAHHIREEKPFRVGEHRLYPDVAVVAGLPDRYLRRSPTPADAPLIIEVADTTAARDLIIKAEKYAKGGVPTYWVVVIPDQLVVVHSRPERNGRRWGYAQVQRIERGSLRAPPLTRAIKVERFMRA
jgi:Uma2 family endonuclease